MDTFNIEINKGAICPYCGCETKIVSGETIYPHRKNDNPRPIFLDKSYYMCINNGDHYVGTYSDNVTSLGRVANKELRKMKYLGHNAFDPLWKDKIHFQNQQDAYKWLSNKMNIPLEFTHFGMFTIEQCIEALKYCDELKNNLN